jgi:hypothetical protein
VNGKKLAKQGAASVRVCNKAGIKSTTTAQFAKTVCASTSCVHEIVQMELKIDT